MSFSCSVPATERADLFEALDALQPSPPLTTSAGQAAFETAKVAFEEVAAAIAQNDLPICGTISGHWYDGASYPKNSITVQVTETDPLPVAEPEAEPEAAAEVEQPS